MIATRNKRVPAARPNWNSPVAVTYEFKTDIFTAFNGTEKRDAVRAEPRITVEFSALLHGSRRQRHLNDLAWSMNKPFYAPCPWRWESVASAAGSTISVSGTLPFWASPGATVIVFSAATEQVLTIASAAGSSVTFAEAPVFAITPGDIMSPVFPSRIAVSSSFDAFTDRAMSGTISFESDPAANVPTFLPLSVAQDDGIDVAPFKPNWAGGVDLKFSSLRRTFDPGIGGIFSDNPHGLDERLMGATFLFGTKAQTEEFIAFFNRQRGCRGQFFIDLGLSEMEAAANAPAASSSLEFEGADLAETFGSSSIYHTLRVFAPWGEQSNRVVSVALNASGNSVLTFADPWLGEVTSDARITWWHAWRWATDKLKIEWVTDEVAEVSTTFKAIPKATA